MMMTDHPRSRGEYAGPSPPPRRPTGSSPLSRGILTNQGMVALHPRIIPALAGNTYKGGNPNEDAGEHPRSRGEYVQSLVPSSAVPGSSPLSRGIPPPLPLTIAMVRIIPALAGNTCSTCANPRASWDHPRSRGEYDDLLCQRETCEGSSPLSRGIPRTNSSRCTCPRIIPALAGNTCCHGGSRAGLGDHPRSRGEYCVLLGMVALVEGSSPLSRGIRRGGGEWESPEGIIPALAGNTTPCWTTWWCPWDHPRSRGEYVPFGMAAVTTVGSSPLSRGIPVAHDLDPERLRIIPALAGNTRAHRQAH